MKNNDHPAQKNIEMWGGIEATINRVGNDYLDQSNYSGHYQRPDDIEKIADLGIKMLRYPVLWEKHQPETDTVIDWRFTEKNLLRLKELNVEPIAGLVHHGSGPKFVSFFDGTFETGVASYARLVAQQFPWLEYYTPVNEPLTTARFCGLYGHWFPHENNEYSFYRILLSECRATIMAMQAIREINPNAKLIQTEDLGKIYSTPELQYQANFENERRWISYELICGTLTPEKPMWHYLTGMGFQEQELQYFIDNPCKPHIAGFNYYITSERYLDENLQRYPQHVHGGNGIHQYADVEVVRVPFPHKTGPQVLLKEAWERLNLPMAITECHLHCTPEEQLRWYHHIWQAAIQLQAEGVDIRAVTAWAIFGTHGWDTLVTKPGGMYEPGVFNLKDGQLHPTAISKMVKALAKNQVYDHAVLESAGWWKQDKRIAYPNDTVFIAQKNRFHYKARPVLIIGDDNLLTSGLKYICAERKIHFLQLDGQDLDWTDVAKAEKLLQKLNPWAIINTATYFAKTDAAQSDLFLAKYSAALSIKLLIFTSSEEITENLNTKKNCFETTLLAANPDVLLIKSGSLFSCWNQNSFAGKILSRLKNGRSFSVADDVSISPTYIPDLVHHSLSLLLNDEHGIFRINNYGRTTLVAFARKIAEMAGFDPDLIRNPVASTRNLSPEKFKNNNAANEEIILLPPFESALNHYLEGIDPFYLPEEVAI